MPPLPRVASAVRNGRHRASRNLQAWNERQYSSGVGAAIVGPTECLGGRVRRCALGRPREAC